MRVFTGLSILAMTLCMVLAATRGSVADHATAPPTCDVPEVESGAEVLLVGAYEGKRYASVSLGDITEATGFADIKVEDGDIPLYVILSAYSPVVWNFSGDIARVSKVVVSGYKIGGVVGIDTGRVAFLEAGSCIPTAYDFESFDGIRAKGQVNHLLDKDVKAGGTYGLDTISIPSMQVDETNHHSGRGRPAVTVDPASVVANVKVTTFEVLPGDAGINQLVENGSLEAVNGGYRIVKPIAHYPAGLHGGYSVRFILGKGIPKPAGDPGHSCVISEEDGSLVAGRAGC